MDITEEQRLRGEYVIYNSPQKYIDYYENGDEQLKEFMILISTTSPEKLREVKRVLEQGLKRAKGQATK